MTTINRRRKTKKSFYRISLLDDLKCAEQRRPAKWSTNVIRPLSGDEDAIPYRPDGFFVLVSKHTIRSLVLHETCVRFYISLGR